MFLSISVFSVLVLLLVSPLIVGFALLARKHGKAGRIILSLALLGRPNGTLGLMRGLPVIQNPITAKR
jgi:hypothetical protein